MAGIARERLLSEELPWFGMADVDAGIMITKDGLLMRTILIEPRDYSFQDDGAIVASLRNLSNGLRLVSDDGWSLYADAHRVRFDEPDEECDSRAPEVTKRFVSLRCRLAPFYKTVFYLTMCRLIAPEAGAIGGLLFRSHRPASGTKPLSEVVERFRSTTDDFVKIVAGSFASARIASSDELLTYLHTTLAGSSQPVETPDPPFYLDSLLADGTLELDSVCRYEGSYILTAGVHDFPSASHAGMVSRVLALNEPFRLVTRFLFASRERTRSELKNLRKAQFQRRKGPASLLQEAVLREETRLEDTEALSLAEEAGEALSLLSTGDVAFGRMTSTVIVRDQDYKEAVRRIDAVKKEINDLGFVMKSESINNPGAFLGSLPGNIAKNPRRPLMSTRNLAHFFPLSAPWQGERINSHLAGLVPERSPHVLCKSGHGPFFLNLNVGDVGHTLVVGPTGSGKSILLSTLALFWLKYRGSQVVFFDKDRSSRYACLNCGGSFLEIGVESGGPKLNPFSMIQSREDLIFVTRLLAGFIAARGGTASPKDEASIYDALATMRTTRVEDRDFALFQSLVQDRDIRRLFEPFTEGEHSAPFTRGRDEIQLAETRWTVFELASLFRRGVPVTQLVLSYLFHLVERSLTGAPSLLLVDECWFFLDNDYFRGVIREWLKVLRKRNAYVVLATQEVGDAAASGIFSTIASACMTKIVLADPTARSGPSAELYRTIGLAEGDLTVVERATPKRDYFYSSPLGKQLFQLELGEEELGYLTSTIHGGVVQ